MIIILRLNQKIRGVRGGRNGSDLHYCSAMKVWLYLITKIFYIFFQTFDCHTFPPVMWCSSKNELKVTVSELKNYDNKNYAITLEIKPFCGSIKDHTTGTLYSALALLCMAANLLFNNQCSCC